MSSARHVKCAHECKCDKRWYYPNGVVYWGRWANWNKIDKNHPNNSKTNICRYALVLVKSIKDLFLEYLEDMYSFSFITWEMMSKYIIYRKSLTERNIEHKWNMTNFRIHMQ